MDRPIPQYRCGWLTSEPQTPWFSSKANRCIRANGRRFWPHGLWCMERCPAKVNCGFYRQRLCHMWPAYVYICLWYDIDICCAYIIYIGRCLCCLCFSGVAMKNEYKEHEEHVSATNHFVPWRKKSGELLERSPRFAEPDNPLPPRAQRAVRCFRVWLVLWLSAAFMIFDRTFYVYETETSQDIV